MEFSVFLQAQDHTKESAAHSATRTLVALVLAARLANKIGQNAIQLTVPSSWKEVKEASRAGAKCVRRALYIPEKLPPREVPNCYFQLPKSDTWRLAHRTVVIPARSFAAGA